MNSRRVQRIPRRYPERRAGNFGRAPDMDPHPDATCSAEANQPTERELGFVNPCRGE
jgi:hypothetical protein